MPADPMDLLKQDPQAAQLLSDPEALRQLLSSPQAQTLANLLRRSGGADLRSAATAAAQGDGSSLSAILSRVSADPAGAKALEELDQQTKS